MSAENQKTILLVDDDMIIAMTIKMTLEKYGYKVMIANTAEEAIATVEKTSGIDLILMDINLGAGIDGTEAAAIILRDHDIPVVFLSSHTEPDIVAKTEKITSYGYVVKNSGDTVLQASIKMAFKLFEAKINEKEKESQREAALEALRESEEKYRGIFDESITTVYVFDANKNFINTNQAGVDLLGYSREELLHMSIPDVDADPIVVLPAHLELLTGGRLINYEHILRRKDGTIITVLNNSRPLRDAHGNVVGMLSTLVDITERIQAEKEKEQFISLQRATIESTTDGILVIDQSGKITDSNKRFAQMWRIPDSVLAARDDAQALHFVLDQLLDPQGFLAKVNELYAAPDQESFDLLQFKDGRCFERYSRPQLISGRPLGRVWSFRNITERKQAESQRDAALEALRESEKRLHAAQKLAHIGVWDWKVDTDIVTWTEELYHIAGLDPMLPAPTYAEHPTIYAPESWEVLKTAVERAMKTGESYQLELQLIRPDGGIRYVNAFGGAKYDTNGRVNGLYGSVQDITEQKRAEKALRESEKRYRTMIENASDIVYKTDKTGNFIFLNRAAVHIAGYEEGELIGKLYMIVIRPDMRVKAFKFYGRQLVKGIHNTYFEIPIITKDGREVWLGQNAQLIIEDGQVTGFQAVARDITERKRAEDAMRESEEKYRILVEKANEAIIIVQDGVFVFANRSMSDLLGVPAGDLEGKPFIDFVWSEDRELVNANYRKRIAGEPVRDDYDFRIIGAGGRLTWVFLSAAVIQWKGKTATLNLLTDITERKRAEEVLQQYNQKWEAITTSSPDGIGMISLDGKLQLMSDKLLTMYGYSVKEKDEVIKKIVFDFIDPSNHKMLFDNMRKLLAGKKDFNVSEYLAIKKDNSKFYVELSSSVLFDSKGDPESILFVERDITERKQAESQRETTLAALRESEENYRLLVENSRDIIYTLNTDGVFTFVSPAWTTLLGHSVNQVVGQPFQQFVHPDDLAGCMTLLQKVIETGQRQDGVDSYRVRHADGSWRWHITNAVPIKDAAGTVIGGEGIARDITERKQAEEEIKQQLAEKGILLKEVHHRIKNNIASIGGLISLHLQSITNPEAVAVLQDAIGRVNSMRLLYDKLLLSEDYKDISVKNYLNELIATIIAIFPDHAKIKFEKRIADFQLDPKRLFPLGSIINELLTNIMKHAFINGDAGSIKISLTNVGGHVKLTIQDNGIGLPEGFDIDKTKGFGLMLVKMLSQQLDGNFSIKKHAGTRCKVEFKI
jgi:PAS domain S-box-containing protein